MRIMRLAAVLAIAAVSPVIAHAQQDGGGGGRGGGGRMMTALFNGITLTDAEQKQVDSIRAAYQPQMQSAGQDRGARRDLMQKQTADFRSVLTSDQQTTFDKNLADLRSRMGAGGGRPQ
jgi:Spy/CpxP family protein refolding chaperone